jgi:uncharacterized membrane protein SpoIIM required for sporulation
MVLELLVNPLSAQHKPWQLFFIGLFYSSAALLVSFMLFRRDVGLVMVFITTLACTYLIQNLLKTEENRNHEVHSELALLKQHGPVLSSFLFLFLGFVVSFSVWFIALPTDIGNQVFSLQADTIDCINSGSVEGCALATEGAFLRILLNNLKVLFFTLLFAFFYGAGAMFILAWNAAIVGTAVGIFVRNAMSNAAGNLGIMSVAAYFSTYSAGLLRYMTHGVFEMLAYFMAALAGGIISIAVINHNFRSPEFKRVLSDSVDIAALSIGMVFFAAIVEVLITPLLF